MACEPAPVLLCGVGAPGKRLLVAGGFINGVGRESRVRCPALGCAWINLIAEPKTSWAGEERAPWWGCRCGRPLLAAFGDQHQLLQRAKASARLGLKRGVFGQVSNAGGEMLLGQTQKVPKGNAEWLGKEELPWEIVSRVGGTFVH